MHPHELAALSGLPAWCIALLVALIKTSNFRTGAGRTGYGELINALTPDQPGRGPRLWAPSRDDIKKHLARFEAMRILCIDSKRSKQFRCVFFDVCPRVTLRVPAGKLPLQLSPTSHEGKTPKLSPLTLPTLTAVKKFNAGESPVDNLPAVLTPEIRERIAKVRGAAGGRNRAPEGA